MRRLIAATALSLLLTTSIATGLTLRAGDFILVSHAGFDPRTLPSSENAPITVHDAFDISLASGETPPILHTITYLFDRHGQVDILGLPVCPPRKLLGTNVRMARRACPNAIVGRGTATATVDFPEQQPFSASSPVTLFNGPGTHGKPVVLAHAYTKLPLPTTFIVPVIVERVRHGIYGFRVDVMVPTIAGGYGHLTSLSFRVGRTWIYRDHPHSYIKGRCETGHLNARAQFTFADGRFLAGSISEPCTSRNR